MITYQLAHELFTYTDGKLFWRITRGRAVAGAEAGNAQRSTDGYRTYRTVEYEGKPYRVHRLIYLMHHGVIPKIVDHINRDTTDNRIENLRAATKGENNRNAVQRTPNTSGVRGVDYHAGKWRARVNLNGTCVFNARFDTREEAAHAVATARAKYHKSFAT
jgi:hypothetical protein